MKTDKLKFRMAARCEAAGRPNNEDNYQLDSDLSDNQWGFTADTEVELGEKGALLVVCDGMGGMNAGEVASDLAVSTIKEWFVAEKLSEAVLASPMNYIKSAIIAADAAIKADAKANPEHDGMGSTIVMAWMLDKKVYVGWCGDSRCYCYNPKSGLARLSHDHSYVQELVDAGKLTEELAFDHPNSNIITRSLGDPSGSARPDVKAFDLHNEDIIMLCSDGLCGCLRDNEIEEQIVAHQTSMQECRDALWTADEAAGWHDNVTIALAQVLSGGTAVVLTEKQTGDGNVGVSNATLAKKNKKLKILIAFLLVLIVGIVGFVIRKPVVKFCEGFLSPQDTTKVETGDTIRVDQEINVEAQPNDKNEGTPKDPKGAKKEKKEQPTTVSNPNPLGELQHQQKHVDEEVIGVITAEKSSGVVTSVDSEQTQEKEESQAQVVDKKDTSVTIIVKDEPQKQ